MERQIIRPEALSPLLSRESRKVQSFRKEEKKKDPLREFITPCTCVRACEEESGIIPGMEFHSRMKEYKHRARESEGYKYNAGAREYSYMGVWNIWRG